MNDYDDDYYYYHDDDDDDDDLCFWLKAEEAGKQKGIDTAENLDMIHSRKIAWSLLKKRSGDSG